MVAVRDGFVIGRASVANFVVADGHVSNRHAIIRFDSRGWLLRDLGSANGTHVDGAPIQEIALSVGMTVTIGNAEFRVVSGERS